MQELKLVNGTCIGANLGSLPVIVRVSVILYRFYPFQGILCSGIKLNVVVLVVGCFLNIFKITKYPECKIINSSA